MSYKAIWNNRGIVNSCTTKNHSCGTTVRHGEYPEGYCNYTTTRVFSKENGQLKFLKSPEYNKIMTHEEANELDKEKGRSVPYFRNSCEFIMSRAARKRGYTVEMFTQMGICKFGFTYLDRKKRYEAVNKH